MDIQTSGRIVLNNKPTNLWVKQVSLEFDENGRRFSASGTEVTLRIQGLEPIPITMPESLYSLACDAPEDSGIPGRQQFEDDLVLACQEAFTLANRLVKDSGLDSIALISSKGRGR